MANTKISNLPSITVPVNDSVIPIVQSGVTSKISYLDLSNAIGGGGSDLATTLGVGNTTGGNNIIVTAGDFIKSSSGDSIFDLRAAATDSFWFLGNDASGGALTGPFGAVVYGDPTGAVLGYNVGRYGVRCENDEITIGALDTGVPSAHISILAGGILIENDALLPSLSSPIDGIISLAINNGTNRQFQTSQTPIAVGINSGRGSVPAAPTTVNDGVIRSVAIGGAGLTVKTDDTAYANQISLQPDGNTFDGLLVPPTLTADRTYTFQDATGTIAFLSDIPTVNAIAVSISGPTLTADGDVVIGNTSGGAISFTLPDATSDDGWKVIIKNRSGGIGNITVTPAAGQVEGAANHTIAVGEAYTYVSQGGDWWIISSF